MAIGGSGGLGFNNPHLRAWLRERTAQRLQAVVDVCFHRAESERAVQRYRAVVEECFAGTAMRRLHAVR